jgi:hypothetical protein
LIIADPEGILRAVDGVDRGAGMRIDHDFSAGGFDDMAEHRVAPPTFTANQET